MDKQLTKLYSKGFRGRSNNCAVLARRRAEHAAMNQYKSRRLEKRDMRSQWIVQINAAARQFGMTYGQFQHGLSLSNIALNRKMLAEIAINEPYSFGALTQEIKKYVVWQDRDRTRITKQYYDRYDLEEELPEAFRDADAASWESALQKGLEDQMSKPQEVANKLNEKLIKDGKAVPKQSTPKVLRSDLRGQGKEAQVVAPAKDDKSKGKPKK